MNALDHRRKLAVDVLSRPIGMSAAGGSAPPPPGHFFDTLRRIWIHRNLVAAATVLAGGLSYAVVKNLASHYVAEARVLVGVPQTNLANLGPITSNISYDAERIQSEGVIAASHETARVVVAELHLADNPEFNPVNAPDSTPMQNHVIEALLAHLDISTVGRSDVLSVKATAENPDTAASIANAVAAAYLSEAKNEKLATAKAIQQYMENRIASLQHQVSTSQQAIEDYRRHYGLYGNADNGIMSQQLSEINSQLILAQTAKAQATANLSDAEAMRREGMDGDTLPAVLNSPLIQALKEQQAAAEQKLAQLSEIYGDQHPLLVNERAEIADIKRNMHIQVAGVIAGLRNAAQEANVQYAEVLRDFDQAKGALGTDNQNSIHLSALERDAAVSQHLLEGMENAESQVVGQQEIGQADAQIVSSAIPPEFPSYPPKTLILVLGTLLGAISGIVIALMREEADGTFRRSDEAEAATGLPVLALVPEEKAELPMQQVLQSPLPPYGEALCKIHHALELSEGCAPKTLLFSSATPGDGKSTLTGSMGRMLATLGHRVLLIDCDWRRPMQHHLFDLSNAHGLASLLTDPTVGLDQCILRDPRSDLNVIPSGDWNPKNVRLLTSERMRLMLETFAKNYDFVILDAPPILVAPEVLALACLVDKVVFTIRWGSTPKDQALQALRQLADIRCNLGGIVLSRVDAKQYRSYGLGPLHYDYARPVVRARGAW